MIKLFVEGLGLINFNSREINGDFQTLINEHILTKSNKIIQFQIDQSCRRSILIFLSLQNDLIFFFFLLIKRRAITLNEP